MKRSSQTLLACLLTLGSLGSAVAQLVVVEPDGINDVVSAGDDFATQVVGDPWDMNETTDVEFYYSAGMDNETVSAGQYHALTTGTGPAFWVHFPGVSSTLDLSRGARNPVTTGIYRYLTVKQRVTSAQPLAMLGYFFRDKESFVDTTYGYSNFASYPSNQWVIVSIDMATSTAPSSPHAWTDFPAVNGIRVSPANASNAQVDVDWVRLTAAPTAANRYTITWTDSAGGPYTATAIDADGARFLLGSALTGTSYSADFSRLAPGDYHIELARAGATATSTGSLHINSPPRPQVIAPSIRGDQSRSYGQVELGNPWGPIEAADIQNTGGFSGISYTNPVGTFYGRPTTGDPWIQMKTTAHPINASVYRSLCFTMEVFGPPAQLFNSVARVYWGNTFATMNPTQDILVGRGSSEYCIEDLASAALEPGATTPWAGSINLIRLDPHEYSVSGTCTTTPNAVNCHDARMTSFVLAPFASASPAYTIQWNVVDADNSAAGIVIYLDPDRFFNNGNEIAIAFPGQLGSGQLNWTVPSNVPNGKYYVALFASDGLNAIVQYSGGPLLTNFVDLIFRDGFE
ncbi:MAG: Ser-Thr-rich GPI-anchored membrane family protein [Tahibacter sp.]